MADKKLIFRCFNCHQDTTLIVNVPKPLATQSKKIAVVRYCEHCNRPNKIEVPDNLDVHELVFGRDKGFLGYRDDIPIIQGEKDL